MLTLQETLLKELSRWVNIKTQLEHRLKDAPKGNLKIKLNKEKYLQYYRENGRHDDDYIQKDNLPLIKALAQKEYDLSLLEYINDRIEKVESLLVHYEKDGINQSFLDLSPYKQELVRPLFLSDEEFVQRWKAKFPGEQNPYPFDNEFFSENGEQVRSKSEKILADKYLMENVPYIYEPKLILSDGTVEFPDFYLLNVRERKTFAHEHFGKMGDPEYAEKNIMKINRYMRNGYLPGENFLCTFESTEHPLDMKAVKNMIDTFLK